MGFGELVVELGRTGVRSDGPADCGVIPPAAPSSLPPGCCEGLAERLNSANARCFMRLEIVGDWCDEAWRGCLPGAFAGRGCKQARQTHCEAAQHRGVLWRHTSTPRVPNVLVDDPTAITSLSKCRRRERGAARRGSALNAPPQARRRRPYGGCLVPPSDSPLWAERP